MREVSTAKDGVSFMVKAPDISSWTTVLHRDGPPNEGNYTVHDHTTMIGSLQYIIDPDKQKISIRHLGVVYEHQGKGVASALLERLHADHPDLKIDPGTTTEAGLSFFHHILEHEPEALPTLADDYVEQTTGY